MTDAVQLDPWDAVPAAQQDPWDATPAIFNSNGKIASNVLAQEPQEPPAKTGHGLYDAFVSGLEGSSTGLAVRGQLPDIELDPKHKTFFEGLAEQLGGLVGDAPAMAVGGAFGGARGAAVGGILGSAAPVVGNAAGALFGGAIGFGAGSMAVPTAIRETLIDAYKNGAAKDSADFLSRAGIVLKATGKSAIVGGLTGYAGARATALAEAGSYSAGKAFLTTAGAEVGAMTVAPAALEGRLPDIEDFASAAVMVGGLKAIKPVSSKIADLYAKVGVTPDQVTAEAIKDPQIMDDLGVPPKITPQIKDWKETSVKPLDHNGVTNSFELVDKLKSHLGDNHFVTPILEKLTPRLKDFKVEVISDSEWKFRGYNQNRQAQTDFKTNTIQFRENIKPEAAFHEVLHEATFNELQTNPSFTKDIRGIMDNVRNAIATGDVKDVPKPDLVRVNKALKNEAEFVAYGLSSPQVINTLRAIRGDGSSPTMFTTFVGKVAQAFGFEAKQYTALHDLIRAVETGIDTSPDLQGKSVKDYLKEQKAANTENVVGKVETVPSEPVPPETSSAPIITPPNIADSITGVRAYDKMAVEATLHDAAQSAKEAKDNLGTSFIEPEINGPKSDIRTDMSKIWTPEEIKADLERRQKEYEKLLADQTRGKVSWEQTEREATEWLKNVLGLDFVPPRQPGTPAGAAELKARADMVADSLADVEARTKAFFEKADYTTADVMEMFQAVERNFRVMAEDAGAAAEVGRALNIRRNSRYDRERSAMIKELFEKYGDDPKKFAEMVLALDTPEAKAKFLRDQRKVTTWDKAIELYRAALLSDPVSHIANIMGSPFHMMVTPFVDVAGGTIGLVTKSEDRVRLSEPFARVTGNVMGVLDGLKLAREVKNTGLGLGEKVENQKKAIGGAIGEKIRTPFRYLAAGDAFVKTVISRGELYTQAAKQAEKEGFNPLSREYRERAAEIVKNPTEAMSKAAEEAALRFSYNTPLGDFGKRFQNLLNAGPALKIFMPFTQTPANIAKEVGRLIPGGGPLVDTWRADFAKGGAARDKAVGELFVGAAIGSVVFSYVASGHITGGGDPDPKKRAAQLLSGWQPYSIKKDGKYYSYQRLAPIGTLIGFYADLHEAYDHIGPEDRDKIPKILMLGMANAITNQTMLQGLSTLVGVLTEEDKKIPKFLQSLAGSMMPAGINRIAQLVDPSQREVQNAWEAFQARTPFWSKNLPPKRNALGEEIETKKRFGVTPITVTEESNNLVNNEIARLRISLQKTPTTIELPAEKDRKIGTVTLSAPQRDKYAILSGDYAKTELNALVQDPTYASMKDFERKAEIEKIFMQAHKYAKEEVLSADQYNAEMNRIDAQLQKRK